MTHPRPHPLPATPDPSLEDISPDADMEVVVEILRQTHPDLDAEDIITLVREVMEMPGR